MKIGAVILAGGNSRRMGRNKMELCIGNQSFLLRIAQELNVYEERLLSVGMSSDVSLARFETVRDSQKDKGPIAGLYAALKHCKSHALLVVPCDVPLFRQPLGEHLTDYLLDCYDAVIAVSRDGRIHPYCGVYRKRAADTLLRQIEDGNLRILDALQLMRVHYMYMAETSYPDEYLTNVNTPEEYRLLVG